MVTTLARRCIFARRLIFTFHPSSILFYVRLSIITLSFVHSRHQLTLASMRLPALPSWRGAAPCASISIHPSLPSLPFSSPIRPAPHSFLCGCAPLSLKSRHELALASKHVKAASPSSPQQQHIHSHGCQASFSAASSVFFSHILVSVCLFRVKLHHLCVVRHLIIIQRIVPCVSSFSLELRCAASALFQSLGLLFSFSVHSMLPVHYGW